MQSFPGFGAVRPDSAQSRVLATRWCHHRRGPGTVRSRFVGRQDADRADVSFYPLTPGHETVRILVTLALRENLVVLCGNISAAFVNTPMPEDTPVYVEPPKGMYKDGTIVWRLRRALNGLREAIIASCGVSSRLSLYLGSTAAIGMSRRGLARLRHLDVRLLWLQAEEAEKRLHIRKCDGATKVPDANTKPVDGATLERCRRRMGLGHHSGDL